MARKKTCDGCRAYSSNNSCMLGYENELINPMLSVIKTYAPVSKCPKPQTMVSYMQEVELQRKRNTQTTQQ